jgi:hypothetical protein
MSMTNNAGSSTGVQKLGNITVNFGIKPRVENVAQPATDDEGYGNYNGSKTIAVSSITGKYADRWDDVGYYE